MGDNVSFKVFYKNDGEEEVRRFVIDKGVSTSYDYLVGKLELVFPNLKGAQYNVCWTDADGDNVTITTDEELIIALTEMTGPLYKMTVNVKKSTAVPPEPQVETEASGPKVHYGVTCDGCEAKPISGNRYKCVVCDDYDLCESCEVAGRHPGHNMIKITEPGYIFPQRLFKRMQVLQDRAKNKQEKQEKKEETRGARSKAEGCRGGFRGGRGMFGPFMQGGMGGMGRGGAWSAAAPAFAAAGPAWEAMMRGWAGEGASAHQQAHAEACSEAEKAAKEAHEQAHKAATAAAEAMAGNEDYLKNVGNFVAAALDPLGIDVKIDIETPGGRQSCHVSKQTSEDGKSDETKETEAASKEEEVKEAEAPKRAATPSDDEEEWTVVKEDKQQGSLYPSLDDKAAEAMKEATKETTKEAAKETGAEASAKAAEETTPSAPVAVHPDPRIQVALQAMMNMGFSNDGGWLSSLLEAKNGDIGKVLDILQPVKK